MELAGPWSFYADFRRAHGLNHLPHPEPPEIALQVGTTLVIPLWVRNPTSAGAGNYVGGGFAGGLDGAERRGEIFDWRKTNGGGAGGSEFAGAADAAKKNELKEITVRAESGGKAIGTVKLRVELRKRALPQ